MAIIYPPWLIGQPQKPDLYAVANNLGITSLLFDSRLPTLLTAALTHSSYLNENDDEQLECNERLEFLGDAVLDLAIAEELHKDDDELREGDMTLIRSKVVSGKTLARVAHSLDIGEHLLLGSGEKKGGGANRNSNLAAAFEAIVGAIFLGRSYDTARDFCIRILKDEIDKAYDEVTSAPKQPAKTKNANNPKKANTAGKHPKSALQEISQAEHGKPPVYQITKSTGKSNDMTFTAQVQVNGKTRGTGTGSSKKSAETEAAKAALKVMT